MKKQFIFFSLLILSLTQIKAQDGGLLRKANAALNKTNSGLSSEEIARGLKEALSVGATRSAEKLSAADGFLGNMAVKVLMPEEAKRVESTLRNMGMGSMVDDAIISMNHAAEEAARDAAPIFVNAIKTMSIQDAAGILKGADNAATIYLKDRTSAELTKSFMPVIEKALEKTGATKHWTTIFETYNKMPLVKKVNTDLRAYVTEKALDGLFIQVAEEEKKIRKDPAARVSETLKKVFG